MDGVHRSRKSPCQEREAAGAERAGATDAKCATWVKAWPAEISNLFDAVVANREVTILHVLHVPRSWVRPPAWESKIFLFLPTHKSYG